VDTQPTFVAIDLAAQLLPGTFEHARHHLLEQAINRTPCDARSRNDTTGAPAQSCDIGSTYTPRPETRRVMPRNAISGANGSSGMGHSGTADRGAR
jgi:hypothetical protein